MSSAERPPQAEDMHWSALPLQYWFAGALIAGSAAILFAEQVLESPTITVGVPLALMAAYIAIGRGYLQHGISRTQYADSIYYLGFLFTLAAITAAIMDYGDGDQMKIISRFGVKLITTLVGLGVRVYLVNFSSSNEDIAENVDEALGSAARRMRDRLDQMTVDFSALSSSLMLTLRTANERVSGELSESITQTNAHFREMLEVTKAETVGSLTELRRAAIEAATDLSASTEGVRRLSEESATTLDALRSRVGSASSDVSAAVEEFAGRLRMSKLPGELLVAEIMPAVGRLSAALEHPATELHEFAEALRANVDQLTNVAQHAETVAESTARLDGELGRLGDRVSRAPSLDALGAAAASAERSLALLATTASEGTARLRQANAQTEEVARAVDLHLGRVREGARQLSGEQVEVQRVLAELREVLAAAKVRRHSGLIARILGKGGR